MNRRTFLAVTLCAPLLSGCGRVPSYRYLLSIEVETPEGLRTGSTIVEVRAHTQSPPFPVVVRGIEGEAAVVDLGRRGQFYALLRSPQSPDWAKNLFAKLRPDYLHHGSTPNARETTKVNAISADRQTYVLQPAPADPVEAEKSKASQYPLLVRFRDAKRFETLETVDPANLAATFGEGVRLKRITVRVTDEAPQSLVAKYLPWVAEQHDPISEPRVRINTGLRTEKITSQDFIRR